jgi:hypothetical protein
VGGKLFVRWIFGFLAATLFMSAAFAGTITFSDLTDNVTFTSDTDRALAFSCSGGETCIVDLLAPPLNTGQAVGPTFVSIAEPGGLIVSDTIQVGGLTGVRTARITFSSDTEAAGGPPPQMCSQFAGCTTIENGQIQTGLTLTWTLSQGAPVVDTILFQSDVEGVPEPSTALLGIMGVGLLTFVRYRRH